MGLDLEQFILDRKTHDATIRQLEFIGEATKNLEENFKQNHTDIPWREISDFRNVLVHEYWDIDLEIVWKAIHQDMKNLEKAIEGLTK